MKVKELMAILANVDPEAELLVCDNGSILNTESAQATQDYNVEWVEAGEFFIVTEEIK
jgi:hypothetical protein